MAGTFAQGTKWNVGDTTGKDDAGTSVALPTDMTSGSGAPSGVPKGLPVYVDTANHKLYAYVASAWVAISGANS